MVQGLGSRVLGVLLRSGSRHLYVEGRFACVWGLRTL